MFSTVPFEAHPHEYDQWFDKHKAVFESEVAAIQPLLPLNYDIGIEVGLGTGRFSQALRIKEGIEPAMALRKLAQERGIEVKDAIAEKLPYKDLSCDFVLMVSCVSYFTNVGLAFMEARRVLKEDGALIVGFIDKNSLIGQFYEKKKRQESVFYKQAIFYTPEAIIKELKASGFVPLRITQTLFDNLDEIKQAEPVLEGYGKGSFVVIKATKSN